MEYCALLIRAFPHKDAFTFNFYEREEDKAAQDYTQDLKSQIIEKLLECHRLALTAFYPANESTGRNQFEQDTLAREAHGMALAWQQILLTVKLQKGEIIDREHLRQIFMG